MPNHEGKNGYGEKICPDEDLLKNTLFRYAREGLTLNQRVLAIATDLNYPIKSTKLKKLNKKFNVPSSRKPVPREEATQAIIDEVEKDLMQANGPTFVKSKLKDKDIAIPRRVVRDVMHTYYPEGFDVRFPGKKKSRIPRVPLFSLGPFNEVSSDGHEKIGQQALRMGDLGLPIYAYKDKWSDNLLKITVVPNIRSPGTIGHLFLDFVEETGGIPVQLTTDAGSEIGWQYALQSAARYGVSHTDIDKYAEYNTSATFAPMIDPEVDPPYQILKSVHNTVIEAFWRWLKEKLGLNLKQIIWQGQENRIFNSAVPFHTDLFYWIFVPLIQAQLTEFQTWWNQHRIRFQSDKNMPSGHIPAHALRHPEQYAGLNCLVEIPKEAVQELRKILEEDVGPYTNHMSWFTDDFRSYASHAYTLLLSPSISLNNAWSIFQSMSDVLEQHYYGTSSTTSSFVAATTSSQPEM